MRRHYPDARMTSRLKVRSDIRSYTVYICRRCGVQSGSPEGHCDAAQSDLSDPAALLNLHDFEPVEFVSGRDFLDVEAKYQAVEARLAELAAAARDYFREFDHLTGPTDYSERAALREALEKMEGEPSMTRTANTSRIIVCEEKHGTYYYDASTDEAWAKSALKILTDRFSEGYWYYDPRAEKHPFSLDLRSKRDELLAITDEQIDAIPSEEARELLRAKRERARAEQREDAEMIEEYERIKAVVEAQDDSFETVGRSREPKAWRLLEARSGHEYEHIELDDLKPSDTWRPGE